jgi:hypothetical protein
MTLPQYKTEMVAKTHEALRKAVQSELERKRRLGHYSVKWKDNQIIIEGEDAPK